MILRSTDIKCAMFYAQIYVSGHLENHTKSHRGAVMAQIRVLDYILSISLPYLIAYNDPLGTVTQGECI